MILILYHENLNRLSNESIKPLTTSHKMLNPSLDCIGTKVRIKFNGGCLKQDKIRFDPGKIAYIYIVHEIEKSVNISSYPTLLSQLSKLFIWCSQINKTY